MDNVTRSMHKLRVGKYGDLNLADRAPEPGSKHDQSGFVHGAWGQRRMGVTILHRGMPGDNPDRVEGVDFTNMNPVFESVSYPISGNELVAQHGERRIERTNAEPITLQELFDPMGEDTFETTDDIRQMILTLMPRESVGRENYSDRGGAHPIETARADRLNDDESV